MNVAHPAMLYGLVLGAIPVIIYYLMRFRSLRVPWGADLILERALERMRRKLYLDQIILLALRVLLVMALVTAFARPRSRRAQGLISEGEVLRILLVDASSSMLAGGPGEPTRWALAREAMQTLVSSWGRGEQWSLYLMDDQPRWVVDRARVETPEHSRAVIDALRVAETPASMARGLEAVLAHATERTREIYLFSGDLDAVWRDAGAVTPPDDGSRVFWFHPPLSGRENLAVTRLLVSHDRVLRGFPFRAHAQVRNYGTAPVQDAELTLLVDGGLVARHRFSLPPGQSTWIDADLRLDRVGSYSIAVRLEPDALETDNTMAVGVDVVPAISVGVLRDADRTGKFDSAAAFLVLAARLLAGANDGGQAGGPLQVHDITAPGVAVGDLAAVDAVVLDGGRRLTPELVETLRQYVQQGGALVLAADDTVDRAAWRGLLGPAGLLPAQPVRLRSEPLGGERYQTLRRAGFDQPAFRALDSGVDGDITHVKFYSWTEFDQPAAGADVLARFADGEPYAWRQRFERGAVLLLAAGLNARNNSVLVRESVYAFLVHLFAEAASAGIYPRRVARREPIRLLVRDPAPLAVQFMMEDEEPVPATLTAHPDGTLAEVMAGAPRSGPASLLVLRDSGHERIWYGIQGERPDSDLTPMPPSLQAELASRFNWIEAGTADDLMARVRADQQGLERYAWVMLLALLLAAGEVIMGGRFV